MSDRIARSMHPVGGDGVGVLPQRRLMPAGRVMEE